MIGPMVQGLGRSLDAVFETSADLAQSAKAYLATDRGRDLRRSAATVVILAAPVVSELPVFRRTVIGRVLRVAGVATLLVKGAEWIRDWDPIMEAEIVDVPEREPPPPPRILSDPGRDST